MKTLEQRSIAILGGGPAGASLAVLLAREGFRVGVFHTDKRPPLIVGESLLPAVIPMLRDLGVEEQIKSFSVYKPGATVCLALNEIIPAYFQRAQGHLPDYAYNTPRDLFDAAILAAAEQAGATVFRLTARLEKGDMAGSARLTAQTLEATNGFFGSNPDFIVDASGRNRAIGRLLDLPITRGGRDDVALFAHLNNVQLTNDGHIHLDRLSRGWCWRIPLPGRVSVGVVADPKHLASLGATIEEQFDRFIREEPTLAHYTANAARTTPVVKYSSYQIISQQLTGPNWALIGDAGGFIDPIFSTGLYLGMRNAFELAPAIIANSPAALDHYARSVRREIKMWQPVIDSWYDGRLFNLYRFGQTYKDHFLGRRLGPRIEKRLARIFSGQAQENPINLQIFKGLTSAAAAMRSPQDLVVA